MNKKRYIFMPWGVAEVGGAELYILNKLQWLRENGWDVHVLSAVYWRGPYKMPELDVFRREDLPILRYAPFLCGAALVDRVVGDMARLAGGDAPYEQTVIESHMGSTALWGELLAEKLSAKHVIALINESFDEVAYRERTDYFLFKYRRGELFGGYRAHRLLFAQYGDFTAENPIYKFKLVENPVRDVADPRVDGIEPADWTVCYIGRPAKPYFRSAVDGVCAFAGEHPDKTVRFVIVGALEDEAGYVGAAAERCGNLRVTPLGDVYPIPKSLFRKIDVTIAGAGSARCSAQQGVLTIVADPDTKQCNGFLGYDTVRSVGWDGESVRMTFREALHEALVTRSYRDKPFRLPDEWSAAAACEQNMALIDASEQTKEYFPREQICRTRPSAANRFKTWLAYHAPDVLFPVIAHVRGRAKKEEGAK